MNERRLAVVKAFADHVLAKHDGMKARATDAKRFWSETAGVKTNTGQGN